MGGGTPVAGLIVVHPSVQIKPVETDSLPANGDLSEEGSDLGVKAVPVHSQIECCIA